MKQGIFMGLFMASTLLLIISMVTNFMPRITFNPSSSAPRGFYLIERSSTFNKGDYILVSLPELHEKWVVDRQYISPHTPLLKQIVGLGGDVICRKNQQIWINNRPVALALITDKLGRKLPVWSGCMTLKSHQFFALMPKTDSLDSRYFGPLELKTIIGRAWPLWTWE